MAGKMIESVISRYLGRVAIYGAAVLVASLLGAQFTQRSESWSDPGTTGAVYAAALSLGPAVAIASTARLGSRPILILAGTAALGMLTMWWLYASSTSSTSALVFLIGWWVGIPLATAVAVVNALRPSDRSDVDGGN